MGHGCHDCGSPNGCTCGKPYDEEISMQRRMDSDPAVKEARKLLAEAEKRVLKTLSDARRKIELDSEIEEVEQRLKTLKARR